MAAAQNGAETLREEGVNALLAQLLREHSVQARAERRSRRGTPDVRIELRSGDLVLLECKWEGSASALEEQIEERLESFPEALGVLGVLYPERLKYQADTLTELKAAIDIKWWTHGSRGDTLPIRPVRIGSVAELADQVRALPLELEGVDRVAAAAQVVGYQLERAAAEIGTHARIGRRIADLIAETDKEKDRAAARRIACLVIFNALAFQDRLADVREDVPTVQEAARERIPGLLEAWRFICESIDYVPVFDLAAQLLDILTDWPGDVYARAVAPLVKAMEETRHLEGHDLSGRLLHTLLTDAKFTGAYYTSVPAATLLTRLVFDGWPRGIDWSDHELPASLKVADLACGTGTLLMAVASEAERRHREAGGNNASELHKHMVERALRGYDVQLSAVHFAATSLAMLNLEIQFDNMHLYVMPLGVDGSNVSLGSLEFLQGAEAPVQFALSEEGLAPVGDGAARVTGRGAQGTEEGITATLPELSLAIMNPPFTRSVGGNLLFGSLPAGDRRKLQDELSRRLKSKQASATAGLGAPFVAAAAPRLRPGEGRLALVLPATVCTGPSWSETRALIEQEFVLDMVIASHDPLRWNFSDSTSLSEALLIATRRPRPDSGEHRTVFANLWANPDGVLDAHRMANAISTTTPADLEGTGTALLEVGGRHVGELVSIPESNLLGGQWIGMQFARADVTRVAQTLLEDGLVSLPGETTTTNVGLCRLSELGEIGPDRRRLVDGFERTQSVTPYAMVEGHDTEQRKYVTCSADAYLSPLVKPKGGQRPGYGEHLWQKSGRLLVAERLRLNTARVLAMRAEEQVLSNVWWPVRIDDTQVEKALALWLNSSVGLLAVLATRTSTEGPWVAVKKADLEGLPVLDTRSLSDEQVSGLDALFDELAEAEFGPLPQMEDCYARGRLDEGVSRILGLPDLRTLRSMLASEPVVSNRRL